MTNTSTNPNSAEYWNEYMMPEITARFISSTMRMYFIIALCFDRLITLLNFLREKANLLLSLYELYNLVCLQLDYIVHLLSN